jgi:hypothetical protein
MRNRLRDLPACCIVSRPTTATVECPASIFRVELVDPYDFHQTTGHHIPEYVIVHNLVTL